MSEGSYDYAYRKVEDMADAMPVDGCCSAPPRAYRLAFREHLRLVSKAMRAIEWNDSCDGDDKEAAAIMACLGPAAWKKAQGLAASEVERALLTAETVNEMVAEANRRAESSEAPKP